MPATKFWVTAKAFDIIEGIVTGVSHPSDVIRWCSAQTLYNLQIIYIKHQAHYLSTNFTASDLQVYYEICYLFLPD